MMYFPAALLLVTLVVAPSAQGVLTLPKIFGSGMVLQQEPQQAHIWGTTDDLATEVTSYLFCQSGFTDVYQGTLNGGSFQVLLGPVPEGEICNVDVIQGSEVVSLSNVLFGDIFVCSGQSNMEWSMGGIFNATEEIAASAEYTNIRMYNIASMTSDTEQEDLINLSWDSWSDPSNTGRLSGFSAVCFLFARSISDRIGKRPFGLIGSNWGGTRIEPWMTPDSLDACAIPPNVDGGTPQNSNSYLYNAMIHPLIKLSIKGALWYQGESNEGWNQDQYPCTFSEMINGWRQRWAENSPTDANFPFGFAQLASNRENYGGYECPIIRWHQTYDFGYAPNDVLQNVFMAVTLDTHDPAGGIHPGNKQTVGSRLAIAGLNVAYGLTEYPTNGPFPSSVDFVNSGTEFSADITYDQEFAYNPAENSGFYVCSQAGGFDQCRQGNSWTLLDASAVTQAAPNQLRVVLPLTPLTVGLAYLWTESPILGPSMAAPIYASDSYQLPGAPWQYAADV
jgi:sialate O-acetylesterase